jgi:hypothetical protein
MGALRVTAIPLILFGVLLPASAHAGSKGAPSFHCPPHDVCSASLGVALRLPRTWKQLPAGKEGPCTLAFARLPVIGPDYDERLIVKLVMVENTTNDRALARQYAATFVRGYHSTHVSMKDASYGGAPAMVIHGLPPTPRPTAYIVVSHQAIVYLISAPGRALDASQRQALAGLRFFNRQGTRCS